MNTQLMTPGEMYSEDVFVGCINVNGKERGILLPPKIIRQYPDTVIYNNTKVVSATSWNDGLANTEEMAKAGSQLAQWALDNKMHIPSLDELEIIYRVCKPTTGENSLWTRSGINLSAVPPTYPYTSDSPGQTTLEQFREGSPEAFDTDDYYWSSTRHPDDEGYAYAQHFYLGYQHYWHVNVKYLGVAVRWINI